MQTDKKPLRIKARSQFKEFLDCRKRWMVLVCHRRAGKTVAVVQKLIKEALSHKRDGPPLRYAYIAPTRDQAKDIAWNYLKSFASKIAGATPNEAELRIMFPNKAQIRLYSGENYERMRGLYFDGVVSDEDADIDPNAFEYVILPCLLDYSGWHCRIGTPKGKNAFFDAFEDAQQDPNSFSLMLKASASGILPKEAIETMRSKMTPESWAQEMECDFNVQRPGVVYAKQLQQLRGEGRICKLPINGNVPVFTFWDLGAPINTSIWYIQHVGPNIHVIDCDTGLDLTTSERVAHLKGKNYQYGGHFLPHDGGATQKSGISYRKELEVAGLTSVTVLERTQKKMLGMEHLRGLLPMCMFDEERCAEGIKALEAYRFEFDRKLQSFKLEPVHDWASHPADALRTYAEACMAGKVKNYYSSTPSTPLSLAHESHDSDLGLSTW